MFRISVAPLIVCLMLSLAPAQAADPIIIGSATARTGPLSPYDTGPAQAAELAVADINARGGVLGRPLKIVYSDTKSDPGLGATAATEVLSQGAELVIVTCDFDYGAPAALAAQSAGKIAFSTCAADAKFGVQGIGPNAYTMSVATNEQGALLAEWAVKKAGWKTVYIMKDTSIEYTKSLCDNFRIRWVELMGEKSIVGSDTWNGLNDQSISGQISRFKSQGAGADFIAFCGWTNNGSMLRQVRAAGIDKPLVASESMDGDYWMGAVPDLSDFYVAVYGSIFGNDPDPKVAQFMEKFKAMFGKAPVTGHSLTGYSVIEAWARAVERAKSLDTDKVRAELDNFKDEPLLIGPTTFTPTLHINLHRPMLLMKVENGKHSPVERFAPEQVPAPKF